jgi:hypothetical protein
LVKGNGDNIVHIKHRNTPLEIFQGVFDRLVKALPCPGKVVLEVLQDVYVPGSFWRIGFPATPIPVVVEIVLSGASLEDLIPGFRPGEFVANFSHWH